MTEQLGTTTIGEILHKMEVRSPLHELIENDIHDYVMTEKQAKYYRDRVFHLINYDRMTFKPACITAYQEILFNNI